MKELDIKKVAIVLRVSSAGQKHDGRDDSIDKQRAVATAWAESAGWAVFKEYDETADKGYQSAGVALDERPYIGRMLADAASGAFDAVIFWDSGRLGRKRTPALRMLADLEDAGVSVGFASEHKMYRYDDMGDVIALLIGQVFAERDYEEIIRKMAVGKYQAAVAGQWVWSHSRPLGYTIDRNLKRLVVDPDDAALVKDIFKLTASGLSTTEVANRLSRKYPHREKGVGDSLVKAVVKREDYLGHGMKRMIAPEYGAEKVEIVTHVGEEYRLVDEETWAKANEELGRPKTKRAFRRTNQKTHSYGFPRGRVKHHHVGYGDEGEYTMNGATRVYRRGSKYSGNVNDPVEVRVYHCNASRARRGRFGKDDPCRCQGFGKGSGAGRQTAYVADLLEARVLIEVIDHLTPDKLEEIRRLHRERVYREAGIEAVVFDNPEEHIEAIDRALADLDDSAARLRKEYIVKRKLSEDEHDELQQDIARQRRSLEDERLAALNVHRSDADWERLLLAVAAVGPFGDSWDEVSQAVRAQAQAILDGERDKLDQEVIELCADLAEYLDLRVTVLDGGDAPEVRLTGALPLLTHESPSPSQHLGSQAFEFELEFAA